MYTIDQIPVSNCGSRGLHKPLIIVNHITDGTIGSVTNTFLTERKSSTFATTREGKIIQYVQIEKAPWTQGNVKNPKAPIIKEMGVNPNLFAVSIEHEGYKGNGREGDLTEAQFWAACWLHKWIQAEVQRIFKVRIPLNSHHVIGHFQIDSVGKPNCPGPKFPWAPLYSELAKADQMAPQDFEEYIEYMGSPEMIVTRSFAIANKIKQLCGKTTDPKYGVEAKRKLSKVLPEMLRVGIVADGMDYIAINETVSQLYNNPEARWKLLMIESEMKQTGLL